jgi:hypothetical protein
MFRALYVWNGIEREKWDKTLVYSIGVMLHVSVTVCQANLRFSIKNGNVVDFLQKFSLLHE